MLVTVIKAFPFSTDGMNSKTALPGEREIPAALVPGLIADGFVCPEGHEPVAISPNRRKAIVDRVTDLFRAHMEALTDVQLLETAESAERQTQAAAYARAERQAADDRAGPVEGVPETGERVAGAEAPVELIAGAEINDGVQRPALGEPTGDPVLGISDVVIDIPTAPLIEIPADWQALHHKTRIALAKKLGWVDGEPTADQANAWIADILVHRERAAPREDLGGLSLQEVHATLTAAGVEWDADTSPADLLELYELAKAEKAGA